MRFARFALYVAVLTWGSILPAVGQQAEFRALADSLAMDIAAAGKKSVAVVDFTDLRGNPTQLGRYLAEEFAVAIARTHKGFEVVDRAHLKSILNEHKLSATGLIDPTTARKIGQFAGADAILTGSMTPFSESVRVTLKVLATDTARIIAADTTNLPKTTTIIELLGSDSTPKRDQSTVNEGPATSTLPSSEPSQPPPSSPVVVADEFQYQLVRCKGLGNSVRCSFFITNRGQDRHLWFECSKVGNSGVMVRAFDDLGNESPGESCMIANRGSQGAFDRVGAVLISGIQVPSSILFANVGAAAKSLSLISLRAFWDVEHGRQGEIKVAFRNVPIER